MLRRTLALALASTIALISSACDKSKPSSGGVANRTPSAETSAPALTDIGNPLYPDMPVPPSVSQDKMAPVTTLATDPIVVRQAHVSLPQTQNVPSKNPGRILWFCTEASREELAKLPPDQIIERPDAKEPTKTVKYRKLREGDVIKPNQMVAILDNNLQRANYLSAKAAVTANVAKKDANEKVFDASKAEYEMYDKLWKRGSGNESDARRAYAQQERSRADIEDAAGQLLKSREDLKKNEIILEEHEVRSTIGGEIKRFYRKPGESIRELDPVAEVQSRDKIRIEGMVEIQHLGLFAGMNFRAANHKVYIEPSPQTGFARELVGHLRPVRGVAVSKNPTKPLIVSASDDKTARVWDRALRIQIGTLPHPVPVQAVACSPPTATENLCLTGADDGVGRLWDLDNPAAGKPVRELGSASDKHPSKIVCAAFAPDGKTCVTADEREIILWDVATGKLMYRFAVQHKAPITYLQFTPQSRLVTEARDRSLIVWKLGDKGAAPEQTIENRTGDVPILGVSPDGKRVLFDQERSLHVLTLDDQRTEGVITAPSDASQFSTFALFSPNGRLVLAAGTGDMPLQLWKTPLIGGRGSLVRRLAAGPQGTPTCAAFAPDGSFAVTGTQDNRVLVWEMPTAAELDRRIEGELIYADPSINAAERKSRVWAELSNPGLGVPLLEGDTVTLIIPRPEVK